MQPVKFSRQLVQTKPLRSGEWIAASDSTHSVNVKQSNMPFDSTRHESEYWLRAQIGAFVFGICFPWTSRP